MKSNESRRTTTVVHTRKHRPTPVVQTLQNVNITSQNVNTIIACLPAPCMLAKSRAALRRLIGTRKWGNIKIKKRSAILLTTPPGYAIIVHVPNDTKKAEVVKLVDTQRSGRCARKGMGVRVPPSAPRIYTMTAPAAPRAAGAVFSY